MTRINAAIPVVNLCDQHLFAEYREIKRIPNTIASGKAVLDNIPESFRLGQGHVKFFYNKLGYIKERLYQLRDECLRRKMKVEDYTGVFDNIPESSGLYGKYSPTDTDRVIILERITERLCGMEKIHYLSQRIDSQTAIEILNNGKNN